MSQHTWLPGNEQYSAMLSLTLVVSHDGSHVHKNVTCKHCMLVIQTSILMFCIGCLLQYGNSHIYFILQIRAMTCDLILIHARNTGAWSNACHSQRLVVAVFPKFRNSVRKQRPCTDLVITIGPTGGLYILIYNYMYIYTSQHASNYSRAREIFIFVGSWNPIQSSKNWRNKFSERLVAHFWSELSGHSDNILIAIVYLLHRFRGTRNYSWVIADRRVLGAHRWTTANGSIDLLDMR